MPLEANMVDSMHKHSKVHHTNDLSYKGGNMVLVITITALVVSAVLIIYDIGYIRGWNALYVLGEHYYSPHSRWPYSIIALRVGFVTALAISSMGIWSRTFRGLIASLIALLLITIGYAWWYFESFRLLRKLEIENYSQLHIPGYHVGGLREGTWWDGIFLVVIVLLLLWHLRILIRLKSEPI